MPLGLMLRLTGCQMLIKGFYNTENVNSPNKDKDKGVEQGQCKFDQ